MKNLLKQILNISSGNVRQREEGRKFSEEMKRQFLALKERGLSIAVFTL